MEKLMSKLQPQAANNNSETTDQTVHSHSTEREMPSLVVGTADVAVFWDYENVRVPSWCPIAKVSESIRKKVLSYGRIVERRLYYDSSKPSEQGMSRGELDLSGFTLVDCPSRKHKETLDKKLIVDVLFFAWERASRGAQACVVLITSDGDYSYTLARLQDIGVHTIIMFRPDVVAKVLIDNANIVMSWEFDVLGGRPSEIEAASPGVPPQQEQQSLVEQSTTTTLATLSPRTSAQTTFSDNNGALSLSPSKRDSQLDPHGMFALFCSCVLDSQYNRVYVGGSVYNTWGLISSVATEFYQKCGVKDKTRFQAIRCGAVERGLVELGRRDQSIHGAPVVKCEEHETEGTCYIRLTFAGLSILRPDSVHNLQEDSGTEPSDLE